MRPHERVGRGKVFEKDVVERGCMGIKNYHKHMGRNTRGEYWRMNHKQTHVWTC